MNSSLFLSKFLAFLIAAVSLVISQDNVSSLTKLDSDKFNISCDPSLNGNSTTFIRIQTVTYGRREYLGCMADPNIAYLALASTCDGQTSCGPFIPPYRPQLPVENCAAMSKHLTVTWECQSSKAIDTRKNYRLLNGVSVLDNSVVNNQNYVIKYVDMEVVDVESLISSCLKKCDDLSLCALAVVLPTAQFMTFRCTLYNSQAMKFTTNVASQNSQLFQKKTDYFQKLNMYTGKYDSTLKHYWPVEDHVNELISGCDLHSDNPTLVSDRFGRPYSAFRVSDHSSFMTAPPSAAYIHDKFYTLMMWVQVIDRPDLNRHLILFGCGDFDFKNNFDLHVEDEQAILRPYVTVDNTGSYFYNENARMPTKQWAHIAIVGDPVADSIFINGLLIKKESHLRSPKNGIVRPNCYFGMDNNWGVGRSMNVADYDEIMIFERALGAEEIYSHFKNDKPFIIEV